MSQRNDAAAQIAPRRLRRRLRLGVAARTQTRRRRVPARRRGMNGRADGAVSIRASTRRRGEAARGRRGRVFVRIVRAAPRFSPGFELIIAIGRCGRCVRAAARLWPPWLRVVSRRVKIDTGERVSDSREPESLKFRRFVKPVKHRACGPLASETRAEGHVRMAGTKGAGAGGQGSTLAAFRERER